MSSSKLLQEFRDFKRTLPKLKGKIIEDEIINPVYKKMLISKRRRQKIRHDKRDTPLKKIPESIFISTILGVGEIIIKL
jgi:hypothetical protein